MIKINLLPSKRKPPKRVTALQQQLILGSLIMIAVVIGMWYRWADLNSQIELRQRDKAAAEAKVREQDTMLKEVKNVEDERKKVTEKIGIIEQLKKNQGGPVRILDEISRALPNGVNLDSLTEASNKISISGMAFTNDEIVRFVDNIKASPFFQDVQLLESIQGEESGVEIYKYKMQFAYKGL